MGHEEQEINDSCGAFKLPVNPEVGARDDITFELTAFQLQVRKTQCLLLTLLANMSI